MARTKMLRVLLNFEEFDRLSDYAKSTDRKISEVVRDYIKRLPKTDKPWPRFPRSRIGRSPPNDLSDRHPA